MAVAVDMELAMGLLNVEGKKRRAVFVRARMMARSVASTVNVLKERSDAPMCDCCSTVESVIRKEYHRASSASSLYMY